MDKKLNRIIDKILIESMQKSLPDFKYIKIKHPILFSYERVFRWIPKEPIQIFIIYLPSHKGQNRFTFELGWSKKGRFPEINMKPSISLLTGKDSEFQYEEFINRLGSLFNSNDCWWSLEKSKTEEDVSVVLSNAIDQLIQFGVPYLKRMVKFTEDKLEKIN